MNRVRLGKEGQGGGRELKLRELFAALDVPLPWPWDEKKAEEIYEKTVAALEKRDRTRLEVGYARGGESLRW